MTHPLLNLGERGEWIPSCPNCIIVIPCCFFTYFFSSLFSHEATTYLPTMAPSSRAPRSSRFPSLATIPCHYMIPRPRAHSISEQFSSTQKNLSYSVSPSTQFSIKLLLHISLSERNKLRRTRGVVDRGRGQES